MYVRVHAIPHARKERVSHESENVYTIAVKEPAERNMANKRIREIIATIYTVPITSVRLLTGHQSSTKMYSVEQ